MRKCALFIVLAAVLVLSGCADELSTNGNRNPRLAHNVYFTLNDGSASACNKLVEDCYKYLANEDGIVFFAAGKLVGQHDRDVNVKDWDVALHVVFETKRHHDKYQDAPDHHKFIEENKANWKSVRVFDSFIK